MYAVASENIELVSLVTKYYNKRDRKYIPSVPRVVAHTKNALSMTLKKSRADIAYKIAQAMKAFIQKNPYSPRLTEIEYSEFLISAISIGDPECVSMMVQLFPAEIPLRNGPFISALQSSSFEVGKILFDHCKIGVNNTLSKGLPIRIACGAGSMTGPRSRGIREVCTFRRQADYHARYYN